MDQSPQAAWPELPYAKWRATCATLHLWTQIVGKIRLMLTPWLNHSWHVALYVTADGLTTSPIPHGSRTFEMQFDFNAHALHIIASDGSRWRMALRPQSVAQFYSQVMGALSEMRLAVAIDELPCEIAGAIKFSQDHEHAAYDPEYANRFWQVLVQVDRVFKAFRTGFIGKSSPAHFFWGSFDLAVTRFSGRAAPPYTGQTPGLASSVMSEAYSHEVSSAGFWPGGGGIEYPAFYSYAYPMPPGFAQCTVAPAAAFFETSLGEFVLPYEAVRGAADPDTTLLLFLQSTYEAAARCAHWDRAALECTPGVRGVARGIVDF